MLRRDTTRRGLGPRGPVSRRATGRERLAAASSDAVSATAILSELEVGPGHDHDGDGDQHHGRGSKPLAEVLGEEHVVVHVHGWHLRRDPRATTGHRNDEVVDAYDAAGDDH